MRARYAVMFAMGLALAGCGAKKSPKAEDQRTASGQILPGSISDAMIAYDALTSQPPMAPRAAPAVAAVAESAGGDAPPEAAPSPAAEPGPAAN